MPQRTNINSDTARTNFLERCLMQYDNGSQGEALIIQETNASAMKAMLPQWI